MMILEITSLVLYSFAIAPVYFRGCNDIGNSEQF